MVPPSDGFVRVQALVFAILLLALPAPGSVLRSNLVSFASTNGAFPYTGLVQATDGLFYGTTVGGGAGGNGTVFALSTSGTLTTLASFGGLDMNPYCPLLEASDGSLYGTLSAAGPDGYGAVFRVAPAGSLTNLTLLTASTGAGPEAGLVLGPDGNFYGTAVYGGTYSQGTIYRVTPAGVLTSVVSFDGTNGANPYAALVLGSDGNFYGTAAYGGTYNLGTVFRLSSAGLLTSLVSFDGTNGANPYAGMVQGSDGDFYGAATLGGTYNLGTVFRLTPAGLFTNLVSFDGTNGAVPYATMLQAADGNFYGTTYGTAPTGVTDYYGSIYRLTDAGALTQLLAFDGASGANPYASLLQGSDGALYGTTWTGGAANMGTAYRLTEPPFFLAQPTDQTNPPGGSITFTASAAGGFGPLSYQWQKDLAPLTDGGRIFGAATYTLTITNLAADDSGAYSLVVSNAFGALTSSNALLRVMLPDRVSPTIAITSPSDHSQLSNAVVTISGVASDDVAVAGVFYQVNGGPWSLATPNDGWLSWSAIVTLAPGTNSFSVYSQDTSGNLSPTNTQSLTYLPSGLLTVVVDGLGTVAPDLNGQFLALGYSYTLNAQPGPGYVFSNWTGAVVSSAPLLTFVMESNMVLQANFVPNLALPPKGTYTGLFRPRAGVSPTNSGWFTLSLSARGYFTAQARFGAGPTSFSGQFSSGEAKAKGIPPGQELATLALDLQSETAPGGQLLTGTLSDGSYTAAVLALLAGRSPSAPAVGQKRYTLALPPGTNAPLLPGGWGALTARLNPRGYLLLAGALGDGTKISQALLTSTNADFPLFAPLHGGKGMLMGWLTLAGDVPQGDHLLWMKPPGLAGQRFYPNGYSVVSSMSGSLYSKAPAGANVLALTNGLLVLQDGNLPGGALTNALALVKNKAVLKASPSNLALTFSPANGTFRGSFTPPGASTRTAISGVVLQNAGRAVGWFLGADQSGQVMLLGE